LVLLLGNTGAGKTALLQNLAVHARKLKTLMFEMELPAELLFERFVAIHGGMACKEVEEAYTKKTDRLGSEFLNKAFRNLFICPESKLTLADLEAIIVKSELKIGAKPALVLIDYIQLMQGKGSRYEKTSDIAEGLKVIAKSTKTIIVVSSQVARPQADNPEISIHSGKDSGSLENSAGLVLAGWRDAENPKSIMLKVLKATKGGGGTEVECEFDGPTLRISQRATTIDRVDVPRGGSND
jgi:replicative DNA helicase